MMRSPVLTATVLASLSAGGVALHAQERQFDQQTAADAICNAEGTFAPFLLQGVTGSGKTDVFLAAADTMIQHGGQVLMLVPEINLTPQLETRVRDALPRAYAVTLHSSLSEGERRTHWNAAANGEAQLVLGTRLGLTSDESASPAR